MKRGPSKKNKVDGFILGINSIINVSYNMAIFRFWIMTPPIVIHAHKACKYFVISHLTEELQYYLNVLKT